MELKKIFNFLKTFFFFIICGISLNIFFEIFFNENILTDVQDFIPYKKLIHEWSNQTFKTSSRTSNRKCTVAKCINVQRCILHLNQLTVALQPIFELETDILSITPEYLELRRIIRKSRYFISNSSLACLILPGIDTFQLLTDDSKYFSDFLELSRKNFLTNSNNLIIFNFVGYQALKNIYDPAISISASFRRNNFRSNFDISVSAIRPYNIFQVDSSVKNSFQLHPLIPNNINFLLNETLKVGILLSSFLNKNILELQIAESFQKNVFSNRNIKLSVELFYYCSINELNLFEICDKNGQSKSYKDFVSKKFDIIVISDFLPIFEAIIMHVLQGNRSILAIFTNDYILPFSELIDWNLFSLIFVPDFFLDAPQIFLNISKQKLINMRLQANKIYSKYFSSFEQTVLIALEALESRLVSGAEVRNSDDWNLVTTTQNSINHCPFNDNLMSFVRSRDTIDINIIIIFYKPIENIIEGELYCTTIINSLLVGVESFDIRTVTVLWNSIDYKTTESPTFDGVRRAMHPLEISLLDIGENDSAENFWTSTYFSNQFRKAQYNDEGFFIINGENYEYVSQLFNKGFADSAFQIWRERSLSVVVFHKNDFFIISSDNFPDFGTVSIFDIKLLHGMAKNIAKNKYESNNTTLLFKNCFSISLNAAAFDHSFSQPIHRFKICHC